VSDALFDNSQTKRERSDRRNVLIAPMTKKTGEVAAKGVEEMIFQHFALI
jgi:hypothetical protein